MADDQSAAPQPNAQAGTARTAVACIAGLLIPGLGHAFLSRWDRAVVFFGSITLMVWLGVYLQGTLFDPAFGEIFSTLKFIANAGAGLLYWIPYTQGLGHGDPTAYTHDYANVYIYVAGLLNMLVVVDVFDIAMGRKK
jgi:hypothetical protein